VARLGWIWLNVVLGFASAVLMLLWAPVGWLLTLPLYWWLLPAPSRRAVREIRHLGRGARRGRLGRPRTCSGVIGAGRRCRPPRGGLRPETRAPGIVGRSAARRPSCQATELRRIERTSRRGAGTDGRRDDGPRRAEKLDSDPEAHASWSRRATRRRERRRRPAALWGIAPRCSPTVGWTPRSALVASCRVPVSLDVRLDDADRARSGRTCHLGVLANVRSTPTRARASSPAPGRAPGRRDRGRRARRARAPRVDRIAGLRAPGRGARRDTRRHEPGRRPTIVRAEIPCASDRGGPPLPRGARAPARGRGHEVVAAVDNGSDLLRAIVIQKPDVAVVDVRLHRRSGTRPPHRDRGAAPAAGLPGARALAVRRQAYVRASG
jgi:hypothetical protein